MASPGSKLSEEQKRRMEENRRKALERRNERRQTSTCTGPQHEHVFSNSASRANVVSGHGARPQSVANSSTYKNSTTKNYSNVAKSSHQFQNFVVKVGGTTDKPFLSSKTVSANVAAVHLQNQTMTEARSSRNPTTTENGHQNTGTEENSTRSLKFYTSTSKGTTSTIASDQSQSWTSTAEKANSSCQGYLRQVQDRTNCKGRNDSKILSSTSRHRTNSSSISGNFGHGQQRLYGDHHHGKEGSKVHKLTSPLICPPEKAIKGTCVLISRKRFSVNVGYHAQLIGIFKTIPSRSYDAKSTTWNFALEDYKNFMSTVKCLSPSVVIDELPKPVLSVFTSRSPGTLKDLTTDEINLNSVDSKLVRTLLPFQKEGVSFGIRHDGRVIIADDMGLGKTIQAICIACYYRAEWPLLVIVPSSVRLTWAQAFNKWLPSLDPQCVNVILTGKDNPTVGLINIISYDLLSKQTKALVEKGFRVIIADESHFIKNHKATRTKAAMQLLKSATRVILLSGTPALSRPMELYTQICAVQSRLFPSYYEFGKRYCAGVQNRFGWDFSGASNMEELQLILEEKIMIRRLKKDVLMQLPSKRRQLVTLDSSMIKTKPLDKAAKELNTAKQKEKKGALFNYFCQTCSVKIQAVTQYISDLLEGGHKFLVFAHHKEMMNAVSTFLKEKGYKFIRIDGSTSSSVRQSLCDRFQKNNDLKVAVLSITAANTGLTLTEATAVVFAELFWNPGALMQAEDRAHRIGQKNSVNVHYLVAKGTADDYLWPLVQHKLEILSKAGLGKDDFSEADNVHFEDPKQQKLFSFFESLMEESMEESMEEFSVEEINQIEEQALSNTEESNQIPVSGNSEVTTEQEAGGTDWFDDLNDGALLDELNDEFGAGPSGESSILQKGSVSSLFTEFTKGEPSAKRLRR